MPAQNPKVEDLKCEKCGGDLVLAPGIDYYCPNCPVDWGKFWATSSIDRMKYPGVAIGVVVQGTHNDILLGKRKGKLGPGQYSLPGGKIDFGETPLVSVIREVKEETNLVLKNVLFTGKVTNDYFPEQGKHYITLYYVATAINPQDLRIMEPDKIESWGWYDVSKPLPEPMWMHTGMLIEAMIRAELGDGRIRFRTPDIDGMAYPD